MKVIASAAGWADSDGDQDDRGGHQYPARMAPARRPEIAEGAKQVGDADQQARRAPTDQVIRDLDSRKAEPDRLKHLLKRAFAARRDLDRAIRSWAAEDEEVARIVASADARRVAYIARMLVAAGVESQRALRRAAFLYWAYLGQPLVMDPRHASIPESAIDDIADLFEG